MIASNSLIARSRSFASIAVLTRVISRLAVSLGEAVQTAQMRSSIAFAVTSSGATFRAPNRKSRLRVRSRIARGGFANDSLRLPDCARAGAAPEIRAAVRMAARNRAGMRGVYPPRVSWPICGGKIAAGGQYQPCLALKRRLVLLMI